MAPGQGISRVWNWGRKLDGKKYGSSLQIPRLILTFFFLVATCALPFPGGSSAAQWSVPVTPPGGSHLIWYEAKADPEDANNLIVCGTKREAQGNAYYGVVYASSDGGESWKLVLEDRSSTWVTEHSCAFGLRHFVYFISEASKVIDGEPHHKLGTTRIFVSSDGGQTWVESAQTGWADFSSSAVSNPRGSSIQRLYVLYNGHTKSDNEKGLGSTLDYFTVSEDGRNVSERQSVSGMAERNYQGVYPSSSVALSDGSVVALYDARTVSVEPSGTAGQEIGVVRFDNRGASRPIIVANPGIRNDLPICPESLSNSLAYDKAHDLLYLAYNDIVSGHCAIFIADSRDGGKTWSASREVSISEEAQTSKYFPILTANRDGLVGLLWRAKPEHSPDCWYFSISRDGLTFSQTTPLAPCVNIESLADQSSAYLSAIIRRPKANQPIALELLTFRDAVMRVGIAATADGVFHPFWTTLGDGSGELRTARILSDGKTRSIFNRPLRASELSDITDQVTLLYGGEQRLDRESQSVMVDISVRNDSGVSLLGPLVLKVEEGGSDFGKVELVKRDLRGILEDNYVDISSSVQGVSLDPGQTTSPYHLIFHFVEESTSHKHRNLILRVKFRILSGKWT